MDILARIDDNRPGAAHRRFLVAALGLVAALAAAPPAPAQQIEQSVAIVSEKIGSRVDGFSFRDNTSSDLEAHGTTVVPRLNGTLRVRTASGRTELTARLDHLPNPASLGPFAVYVLWVITPEGRANNVGVFDIDGERGRLEAATPLTSFALIVTAEPHFAVSIPGQHVVAQFVGVGVKGAPLEVRSLMARADYGTLPRAVRDAKQPVPLELEMARYALAIASGAGAPALAPGTYGRAEHSLATAEGAFQTHKSGDRPVLLESSREAIQAAEDARAAAELRRGGAELAALRQELTARDQSLREAHLSIDAAETGAAALREQIKALQTRLPTAASRVRLASELLARWMPTETQGEGLVARVQNDDYVKGRPELMPATRERLAIALGVVMGIGGLSVSVSPGLQMTEDLKLLALGQQRARGLMDWFASVGVHATIGAPPASATTADAALSDGPGVDLTITGGEAAVDGGAKTDAPATN